MSESMKTFLIAPVRGQAEGRWRGVVDKLSQDGWEVYWPSRDTAQDGTSAHICTANYQAILEAEAVHIIWDGKSQGCLFDLGMAFALSKRIIPIDLPPKSEGKSFQNFIREIRAA